MKKPRCGKCGAELHLNVIIHAEDLNGTPVISRPEVSAVTAECANCGYDVYDVEVRASSETKERASELMQKAREAYHNRS